MKKHKRFEKYKLDKGIYILPNLFTSLNMFCGFYAIISSIEGEYLNAAVSLLIAVLFDVLDGKIARATKTTSRFGVEYDSLADLISFGVAPGVMMYLWALKPFGRLGWLAAFLFMACGALRLARFNTQAGTVSNDYFTGLPIPAGASMNATTILLYSKLGMDIDDKAVVVLVMLYILSFLMVSTIKYNSFKKPGLFSRTNFNSLVTGLLILIFIAAQPSVTLFILGLAYVISGPFTTLKYYRSMKKHAPEILETGKNSPEKL
jgi:CDP-diacylglycerol---serine O-phosphatidyltransferase